MTQRLMLLDTASLYFRAFFGVPDTFTAPSGEPVNAVRGMLDFVARLVGEYEPTHLACCWDNDWRPQWRVDLLPTYKAHRVVEEVPGADPDVEEVPDPLGLQVPVIAEMLRTLGIAVVGADGYEADDVIGTLATDAGMPVEIVTGDRDLFQLVDDSAGIRVLYTARGVSKHDRVDEQFVVGKYGVLPQQYADYATLRGDASDGLPGVPGVGEKTAASLLLQYGDLQGIRAAAEDPDSPMAGGVRGKLRGAGDYLDVAPQVVAVVRDLGLGSPDLALPSAPEPGSADDTALRELAERWGVTSSVERVLAVLPPR
ncbi:5'-3' exonuclease [Alteromonas gracilis]